MGVVQTGVIQMGVVVQMGVVQMRVVQSGVNKKPLACPFQDRQFQNPDRLVDSFRNFY